MENKYRGVLTIYQENKFVEIVKSRIKLYKSGLGLYGSENTNSTFY